VRAVYGGKRGVARIGIGVSDDGTKMVFDVDGLSYCSWFKIDSFEISVNGIREMLKHINRHKSVTTKNSTLKSHDK
jgi:hypothetical protein